jgi:PQQ-dependent dehydrogenase (methanol/ethanol family)
MASGITKFGTVVIAAILSPVLWAQNPPDIQQTYSTRCGGCHGDDGRGTQQGPALAGSSSVRARSALSLRNVIRNGVPAAGMPAFDLPTDTIDALATMIASWNAVAAKASVPGDAAAGRQFFVGKGQCVSCHLAQGEGTAVGPDLSDIALTLTVDEIRDALLNPDARIAPGYGVVSVRQRDGRMLRGFARSRSSFDLAIQDLTGAFHTLSLDDVASITDEKTSHMAAVKASADELRDVIAYLSRLTGVKPGALASQPRPDVPSVGSGFSRTVNTEFDFSRILNPKAGEWPTFNGNVSGNRYSPLTTINKSNVSRLSVKWTFTIPLWSLFHPDTPYYRQNMQYFGLETVPIVADGVMYVTGPNQVFALDPRTGHQIWHYSRPRSTDLVSDASLGTNRGVAVLGDHVFMVTDNAHLVALHRVTGRPVWEVVMPDEAQRYGGTMAPLIVKDMVIAGVSGGDWGIRGFLSAYKAATGERVWRHWTIPAKGDPGFETWKGSAVATGGGGTWQTGSYDPETDTLYWATGNPWPNSDDRERGGDNLFTDCVLALDPATGKLKWYYQFTPHDVRDWDANEPNVLVNTTYRGQERKLLLHADRNGFFYVFDRTDGKLLLAEKFVRRLTWASGIGADGRPVRIPERDVSCPGHATNWHGTAFSPVTRLYYVQATEQCIVRPSPGSWKTERPRAEPATRYLRAIDIETGKIVWEIPQAGPADGKRDAGVLGTAAGILFYGDASGYFVAVDERDGKTLWRVPLNATIKTSPMTFAVGGQQFIALAVGSTIVCFGL